MTTSLVLIIFLDAAKGYFDRVTVLSVYGITWQSKIDLFLQQKES